MVGRFLRALTSARNCCIACSSITTPSPPPRHELSRAMQALRAAGLRGGRTPIGAKLRDAHTGVDVDLVGTGFEGDERALARSLRDRRLLPVIPVGHLILMKLESGRSKDDADVVELLKAGASPAAVARYLRRTWPELLPRFRRLTAQARTERTPRPRRAPVRRTRR